MLPDGKATILFDAPQAEVRALLWAGDGALYAGTAAEAGGGSPARGSLFLTQGGDGPRFLDGPGFDRGPGAPFQGGDDRASAGTGPGSSGRPRPAPGSRARDRPGGGSASPRPVSSGDNAVYRLDSDGVPREVLRVKALVHALVWADDRLLAGTGPEGQLYEIRDRGDETAPLAKLDSGQILSLLVQPDGTILIGTGDPGSVVRLASGHAAGGYPGLGGSRYQAGQPVRLAELARRVAAGHFDLVRDADGQCGRARRDLVALVGQPERSRRRRDRVAAGSVHPVSGQARPRPTRGKRPSCARFP